MIARVFLTALALTLLGATAPLPAQTAPCDGTPAYSPCEFLFELSPQEAAAHPNPYATAEINIEFRSPRFRTFRMPAYWAGGRKMVVRFSPTEAGNWVYRITGNVASVDGRQGSFQAADSDSPGYIHPANAHHWVTENKKPHLWMGMVIDRFGTRPAAELEASVAAADSARFTHIRASLLGDPGELTHAFTAPDKPNTAYFDEFDRRILSVHKRKIATDLILAADPSVLTKQFPDWQSRKLFVRYLVARYGALNITWQGCREFEGYPGARALLKEIGLAIKELDAYQHPRSTNAQVTSSPLISDGWMDFIIDHSSNDQIGAVEHQFYQVPFVGVTPVARLWSATLNGQYPEIEGPPGSSPKYWFDLMAETRFWEMEPFYDLDAARATALDGVDYVVVVEKSGPIEVNVEKHGYDVSWMNPLTGETSYQKKYKGEHFTGSAPDTSHPWVLRIAREGHVESMNKSYRFESRPPPVQEIEQSVAKVPFEITEPAGDTVSTSGFLRYSIKLKRETRATRAMQYVWSAEIPANGEGPRIVGSGSQGTFKLPPELTGQSSGALSIHVSGLNANGKAYSADKVYQLAK